MPFKIKTFIYTKLLFVFFCFCLLMLKSAAFIFRYKIQYKYSRKHQHVTQEVEELCKYKVPAATSQGWAFPLPYIFSIFYYWQKSSSLFYPLTDRRPFTLTSMSNLKSQINLTPLTVCHWTVGGSYERAHVNMRWTCELDSTNQRAMLVKSWRR